MAKKNIAATLLLTVSVWGLAGALFGSLFAALYQVLVVLGFGGWQPLIVGAAVAATTTAAFYSAMPVALIGALAGVLASIVYLMVTGHQVRLLMIALVAGGAGVIAGIFYAWTARVRVRPLADTLIGLLSGLFAGSALAGVVVLSGAQLGTFVMAAGVVAIVGSLFQLNQNRFAAMCSHWLPRAISAPVVAGLIASVVGASIWIMGGPTAGVLDQQTVSAIDQVLDEVPAGFLGGLLGGAVTGVLLALLGVPLEYRK
jgi:hypothetical protein